MVAPTIPGPVERSSFIAEQTRRRRETWRLTAACALVTAIFGIPLSMVTTPALVLVAILTLRAVDLVIGVPGAAFAFVRSGVDLFPAVADTFLEDTPERALAPLQAALGVIAIIGPGVLVMIALWLLLRRLFVRAGAGGVLLALGARPPRQDDLEERQLVNVVEEMAIASGLPPPRVALLDDAPPNAAAVGANPEDATLIVSRKLLDELDRDETQGVVGHLVASVGNGDLRIALTVFAAFGAIGIVLTVFDAVFGWSRKAWRELAFTLRWILSGGNDARTADAVAHMLSTGLESDFDDSPFADMHGPQDKAPKTALGRAIRRFPPLGYVLLPLQLAWVVGLMLRAQIMILRAVVAGPLIVFLWRARRYLADASAVELTRNPDGLARALRDLGAVPTGGEWAAHLFVHAPPRIGEKGTLAAQLGGIAVHPPVEKRIRRLEAQGAQARPLPIGISYWRRPRSPKEWAVFALVAALGVVCAALMTVAVVLISGLAFFFAFMFMFASILLMTALLL